MEAVKNIKDRSDAELVEAMKNSQLPACADCTAAQAFDELLRRYSEKAYRLAMRITRQQEDAEEVLQETFLSVFDKISEFRGTSAFSSWLYRITVNTAFMKLRKRRKHSAVELDEQIAASQECWVGKRSDVSDTNYLSAQHELRAVLEQAIEALPVDYRTIFVLRDVDGLSNQQVSEIMDLSVPAIKSRLHRSRLLLRKRLRGFYEDYMSAQQIAYGPRKPDERPPYRLAA